MKKRMLALLLALCLMLSAAPAYAGAATGQQVSANAVSAAPGKTASVILKAENFSSVAALDVYVYYDPAVFSVSGTTNGTILSSAQSSVNTAKAGEVTLSAMSLGGMNGSGNLLTIRFSVKADAVPGTYPITVAIGRAFDGTFAPVTIAGVSGSVTVTKPVETESFAIYGYPDKTSLKKDDVLSYRVASASSSRAFVSGEFTVEYDHEIFAFDSATLEAALTKEGALYSINSGVLGQVRIVYASETPVKNFYLFTVKLKVIADVDTKTTLTAKATNVYREDLSAYLPGSYTNNLTVQKTPEVADYADAFLRTDRLVVGKESKSLFCLEGGSGVAAADFRISYDPAVLRCVAVAPAEGLAEKGGMAIINDNFHNGLIKFSYVNMQAQEEELPIVEITWEPIAAPANHSPVEITGVGVVDAQQKEIPLDYVVNTQCIYVVTGEEPTCQKDGALNYLCGCGDSFSETLPKEDCDHGVQSGEVHYDTLQEAVSIAPEGSVLQLLRTVTETVTVEAPLTLDLNGFDLIGDVTGKLLVIDSQTDDFTVNDEKGYGKIIGNLSGVNAREGYMMITEESGVSFHRVDLQMTHMALRSSAAGVYYKSNFAGDELVAQNVERYGIALSVTAVPDAMNPGVSSWYREFSPGMGANSANGTLLKGVMKETNSNETNAENSEMPIYGRAYILTKDGQYVFGKCVSRSFRQQVELIDRRWEDLTQGQKTEILALYKTYEAAMTNWDIPNLRANS